MLQNYIQSKTFGFSTSALEMGLGFSQQGKNNFDISCRITPLKPIIDVSEFIALLSDQLGHVLPDTTLTEQLEALFETASEQSESILTFNDNGITIGGAFTVGYEAFVVTYQQREKKHNLQIELEGAGLAIEAGTVDISMKGSFQINVGTLSKTPFLFTVDAASDQLEAIKIPLPLEGEDLTFTPSIFSLSIKKNENTRKYVLSGKGSIHLAGGPAFIQSYLPSYTAFELQVGATGISLIIPQLFDDQAFGIPNIPGFNGDEIQLGELMVSLRNLTLSLGRETGVSADLELGLPEELNVYLQNMGLPPLLNTYDPSNRSKSQFGCRLALTTSGMDIQPIGNPINLDWGEDSPIRIIRFKKLNKEWYKIKLGKDSENGEVDFMLPQISKKFTTTSLSVSGAFEIVSPLSISLTLVKRLVEVVGLSNIADQLPPKVKIESIKLLDDNKQLNLPSIIKDALPGQVLDIINKSIDVFPDKLKEYLEVTIPNKLSFDFAVSPEGTLTSYIWLYRFLWC